MCHFLNPQLSAIGRQQNLKIKTCRSEPLQERGTCLKTTYFCVGAAFLAALFLGAAFFADAFGFAALVSPDASAAGACFFGLATFFGSSGAENFCPSNAISVIRTELNAWRCPCIFLYCFFLL